VSAGAVAWVAATSAFITGTAFGQEAPTVTNSPELQELVVTGSMINKPNAETAEAIAIIQMDALKDIGVTTVEQALTLLSANRSTLTTQSAVASFTGGGSFAGLRGLNPTKTLVLLDGQRLANNVTVGSAVDVNTIPFAAIDHIEVLREGA